MKKEKYFFRDKYYFYLVRDVKDGGINMTKEKYLAFKEKS